MGLDNICIAVIVFKSIIYQDSSFPTLEATRGSFFVCDPLPCASSWFNARWESHGYYCAGNVVLQQVWSVAKHELMDSLHGALRRSPQGVLFLIVSREIIIA